MGAEQEKYVRITRAEAKKRAAAAPSEHEQQHHLNNNNNKRRVCLKDITNLPISISDVKSKQPPIEFESRDSESNDDPQMCCAYAADIYGYLHSMEIEQKRRPIPDYMEKIQTDVTSQMRGILVDWLVEVAQEYKLLPETLYLTVSYLDRYLSSHVVHRRRLQLVGVSCMLIASKYEEISPPHVEDFCYITDNTYTKQEVVKMESDVLNSLHFEMGNPTIKTFLPRFTRTAATTANTTSSKDMQLQAEFMGCYLAELSLLDYDCLRFLPSMIAASAVFLTNFTLRPKTHPWKLALQQQSGYSPADLKDCVSILHDLQLSRKGGSLMAVRDKYKQHKFKCVATITPPSQIPTQYFEDVRQ